MAKTLDELLEDFIDNWYESNVENLELDTSDYDQAKADIKALMLEIIGEDTKQNPNDFTTEASEKRTQKYIDAENRLRAELRSKINAL